MIMKRLFIIFFLITSASIFAQAVHPARFPFQDSLKDYRLFNIVKIDQYKILTFWIEQVTSTSAVLKSARSSDGGYTWIYYGQDGTINQFITLADSLQSLLFEYSGNNYYLVLRGRYAGNSYVYNQLIKSTNGGYTWQQPVVINTGGVASNQYRDLVTDFIAEADTLYFAVSKSFHQGVYLIKSTDGGATFSAPAMIEPAPACNPAIVRLISGTLVLLYQEKSSGNNTFYTKYSHDDGFSWTLTGFPLFNESNPILEPRIFREQDNSIKILYKVYKLTDGVYKSSDIYYRNANQDFYNISLPYRLTYYAGEDKDLRFSKSGSEFYISLISDRYNYYNKLQGFYGKFALWNENTANFAVFDYRHTPEQPQNGDRVKITLITGYSDPPAAVIVRIRDLDSTAEYFMYDDGTHGDSIPGDKIYTYLTGTLLTGYAAQYSFIVKDADLSNHYYEGGEYFIPFDSVIREAYIKNEHLYMPFDYNGVLADVNIPGELPFGGYDSLSAVFSAGFSLSGLNNSDVWSNAVMTSSRIQDYRPGTVGGLPNDPSLGLFRVTNSDSAFGPAWQNWKFAVNLGAPFHDGNGDGIYNPVDINGSGHWEPGEDAPEMPGDVNYWCVINDNVPSEQRRYSDVQPMGIEIGQLIFGFPHSSDPVLRNTIFVKYDIKNKGSVAHLFDSVYFAVAADPDLGDYTDDFAVTDTLTNSVITYNDGPDQQYGINPPAVMLALVQGVTAYIPGETFTDNNGNRVYDPGIDYPLDTAFNIRGRYSGTQILPGAKNLGITGASVLYSSHPTVGDPNTKYEIRNYMKGLDKNGNHIDPCTFSFGTVRGPVNCAEINSVFRFSGDPVTDIGWLPLYSADIRTYTASGSFILAEDQPVSVIAGYIFGRGTDHLNSVTVARNYYDHIKTFFNLNGNPFPVGVQNEPAQISGYNLLQNFPNPFNPETRITFSLPREGRTELLIYDITGRLVKTLVNEVKPAGSYTVSFNATGLASGVYFCMLRSGGFVKVQKMMLLQ